MNQITNHATMASTSAEESTGMHRSRVERLRRYGVTAATATVASAAGGSAFAGIIPPDSAASGAAWNWSATAQNNALFPGGATIRTRSIWGPAGSLLSNNIYMSIRRFINATAAQRRDVFLSQKGWNPGVHYVQFGAQAAASGAMINANATGGGATAWANSQAEVIWSSRAGSLANTTQAWNALPGNFAGSFWGASGRGYVAFKIEDFGKTYYGWLDIETQEDASKNLTVTIHGWAYSTGSILAGASPVAVPGGAGLAALAFGAAGLRGRRRSRN